MTTPAEELRAAATLLRDTASKAAEAMPPPWRLEAGFNGEWLIGSSTPHLVANARKPAAAWVALAHPGIAEPLAAWLDATATDIEISGEDRKAGWSAFISPEHPALAVARTILRRDS